MLLLDWIDINKNKFINCGLYGKDLAKYADEIQELEEFKNREIRYPDDPRIEIIENGVLKLVYVGDWDVDIHNYDHDRSLSRVFSYSGSRDWHVIHLYGINIKNYPKLLNVRVAFVEDKELRKNYERVELIEDMLKNN